MKGNKHIERDEESGTNIYNNRSLAIDFRTLPPLLRKGMRVLDVGCGTGAISKDIARLVGPTGHVVGIDNTAKFIESGRKAYGATTNLTLLPVDLFALETEEKFDLIVAARVLQWLKNPEEALLHMKQLLNPNGQVCILDYNHEALEWEPQPPTAMLTFYAAFLKWRADAGLNNHIAEDLADMMRSVGFQDVKVTNSDEHYVRTRPDFLAKVGIWSKVATLDQVVNEGYVEEAIRQQAITEYDDYVANTAISMTMKLNAVQGRI